MRLKRYNTLILTVFLTLLYCGIGAFTATAQEVVMRTAPENALYRGVAVSASSGMIYATDYASGNVLRLDADTLEVTASLAVQKGPTHLALSSDGRVLACINSLSNTLSLVELASFKVYRTLDLDDGPNGVEALPGGGFAVSHSFSDSVYLIDEVTGTIVAEMNELPGVPAGVASTESTLAVILRAPSSLLLYTRNSSTPKAQIPLTTAPVSIAALPRGQFIVATTETILLFNEEGIVLHETRESVTAVVAYQDGIAAVQGQKLLFFDNELTPIDSQSLDSVGSRALSAAGSLLAIASSASNTLEVLGEREQIARAIPEALDPIIPEKIVEVVVSQPVEEPVAPRVDVAELPEPTEEPIVPQAQIKEDIADTVELLAETKTDVEISPTPTDHKPEERIERKRKKSTRSRFAERPGQANIMGNRPHAPKLGDKTNEAFMSELSQGLTLNQEGSIMGLDWTQDLTDISSEGDAVIDLETGISTFPDGVDFKIDEAMGHADSLVIDRENNIADLVGYVSVSTETSRLEADSIHIEWTQSDEKTQNEDDLVERDIHPLVPAGWEPRSSSKGFTQGIVEATNVKLDEPDRFLLTDTLNMDLYTNQGDMENVHGRAGPLYFKAKTLRILGPADVHGEDIWVTTCDHEVPHYRLRLSQTEVRDGQAILGTNARLQLGKLNTPLVIPRFKTLDINDENRIRLDFDSGSRADIGFFVNYAQWYQLTDNIDLGLRVYPTSNEGVGFGIDTVYDFMEDPTSPFFRSKGEIQTMYTTEKRGYTQIYHRQELTPNTVILGQWEQWYDKDFVKDFYNDIFQDRTGPRTFLNITHTKPGYIAEFTASKSTHNFVNETEKLPEAAIHLLERPIWGNLFLTFDAATGYYKRNPDSIESARTVGVARLSYDWNVARGLNVIPFIEIDGTRYSNTLDDGNADTRFTGTSGVTTQARFQRAYKGRGKFSGFKHIIVPSITFSYRNRPGLDAENTPRFDDLDDRPGRSRLESKLDNIILGRNAETGEVWRVARLSFFQGNDFWNETSDSEDYEVDFEIRPRPWWGLRTIGESHNVDEVPGNVSKDFNRVLSFLFFDNSRGKNNMNWRLGFALTEVAGVAINREVLYGMGYRLSPKWSVAAEHRYDLERNGLVRQSYEIRRRLHRWEMGLRFLERDSGVDVRIEFSLIDFPGASLRF